MRFARPEYLHLLWGVPLLAAFFVWSLRNRRRRLETFVSAGLAPQLSKDFSRGRAVLRAMLLFGFFTFSILALARPQWGARLETVRRHGVDIVAALDTSYSMQAEDIAPCRLEKAKSEIRTLLEKLKGDRFGLVTFAGIAVVQCPLTLDYGAARLFLDVINTDIIPEPGTALASAIETAISAFNAKERKYKVLIIFTDGEDLEGKPIPVRDEKGDVVEYRKDADGQIVVSRLDETTLVRIAAETGGRYYRATTSESELDAMYEEISGMEKKELESRLFQSFEDQFQYPLAAAVLCLAAECWISDRRKRHDA